MKPIVCKYCGKEITFKKTAYYYRDGRLSHYSEGAWYGQAFNCHWILSDCCWTWKYFIKPHTPKTSF